MQTPSSQPTISSFPVPKKSATFLKNILERPELEPAPNHPLVQPEPIIPVSSAWEKHLPFSWKPGSAATETKNNPPSGDKVSIVAGQNKDASLTTPTRRKLPDEIKAIFQTSSNDFAAAYKKNGAQEINGIMDEWDRALLLGEYPPAALLSQKPKRVSFVPAPSFVPQKSNAQESGTAFPSRVMDEGVASPVPRAEFRVVTTPTIQIRPAATTAPIIPQKPQNALRKVPSETIPKKTAIPLFVPNIPIKPKRPESPTNSLPLLVPAKNPLPPLKPAVLQTPANNPDKENHAVPPPNMSETLVEKIIEGQMRGVFENAPPLLQKELEKMTVREIMAVTDDKTPRGTIENEVWKKRLREYLAKIHEQAISSFSDINIANPTEGELVLDYVKRVYPILLKAQVTKI